MATILIIEDNIETQVLLQRTLSPQHKLVVSYNLMDALKFATDQSIDLVLLDLILPDGNGMTFLKSLCQQDKIPKIPVIILSGIHDLKSRVEALNAGADDFIIKPFDKEDILARLSSVLRRGPARHSLEYLNIGNLVLDLVQQSATAKINNSDFQLNLTPIEFKILVTFCNHLGKEFSREQLKQLIWKDTYISLRNIDTHICNLRKKLEPARMDIQNKRSKGYFLVFNKSPQENLHPLLMEPTSLPSVKVANLN